METYRWLVIILGGMNLGWVIVGIAIFRLYTNLAALTKSITRLDVTVESLDKRVTKINGIG